MKKEETFLRVRPDSADLFHLRADHYLTLASDKQKIKRLKDVFQIAVENNNDETAKALLVNIKEAYLRQKRTKQEKSPYSECIDYLMEAYWQLPDMEQRHDVMSANPIMLQTKFWILERVASEWTTEIMPRKITEKSIAAFRFLIAAFSPLDKEFYPKQRSGESKFELKARGRRVSSKERDKILELIRKQDTGFTPEEIEFWMSQPYLPYQFVKTLAIARTRNGGIDRIGRQSCIWREDIRNAKLLKPFSPEERTEAAIDLHKRHCKAIVNLDKKVKELLKRMKADKEWDKREKIGASEYTLGDIRIAYESLFEIIIHIRVESEHPENLVSDNFGRARRHVKKWLEENPSMKVTLSMFGGKDEHHIVLPAKD